MTNRTIYYVEELTGGGAAQFDSVEKAQEYAKKLAKEMRGEPHNGFDIVVEKREEIASMHYCEDCPHKGG